jgi:diguanylate cyclase (GGDEF)-like protein
VEKQLDSLHKNSAMNGRIHVLETATATIFQEEELISKHFLLELQSTLCIEQLLEIFFRRLDSILPCDGLDYRHAALRLFLRQGNRGRHRTEYRLAIGQEDLGEIRISRRRPFSEDELGRMEILLGALILPIRNALHYRQALDAASMDPLTGLKNRRSYNDNLEREISRARREGQPLGLMVIDIDWFKQINDEIGHLAGDQVLAQVAAMLRNTVRRSDMVFRFAGDEFVLLLPNIKPHGLNILASRIRKAADALECSYGDHRIQISLSIGTALLKENMNGEALFEAADLDMLCEKADKHGKSCPGRSAKSH